VIAVEAQESLGDRDLMNEKGMCMLNLKNLE